jgi:ribonuclease HI
MKNKLLKSLNHIQKQLGTETLDNAFSQIESFIRDLPEQKSETETKSDDRARFLLPVSMRGETEAYAIFSDGACRGNPGAGAYGCFVQDSSGEVLFEKSEVFENTTNNRMELLGVIEGLATLGKNLNESGKSIGDFKIVVVTDSKYVVDGTSKWMAGWKSRGWKKADKKPPENLEMWKKLDLLKERIGDNLILEWVKGHAGHPQNERCDQLANEALDREGY